MKKFKVCHITSVHRALDIRIFNKEAVSLAEAGIETYIVGKHHSDETVNGVKIIALSEPENRFYRFTKTIMELYAKAIKINADIYHFHDPELISLAAFFKLKGKKVIYDVHENIPNDIFAKKWIKPDFLKFYLSYCLKGLEKYAEKICDGIVTVTPEIAERFDTKKTILLRNFPSIKAIDSANSPVRNTTKFTFIYAGGLTEIRGIREIIKAVGLLKHECELILVGNWQDISFKEECYQLNGFEKVVDYGFVSPDKVYSLMKHSDCGLGLLYPTKGYLNSYPVKAFEYMACSLPMIISDFPLWKEMFSNCSLFNNPNDVEGIAASMDSLIINKELHATLSKSARASVLEKFSWESESNKIIDFYTQILK
jgi:glycosyltransferase involved in cell wall biosynthesis